MWHPLPFFPEYTIEFPMYYTGGRNVNGIIIRNKRGLPVNPKGDPLKRDIYYVLKNPDSLDDGYQKLYQKNVTGICSQSLYASDLSAIYRYLNI